VFRRRIDSSDEEPDIPPRPKPFGYRPPSPLITEEDFEPPVLNQPSQRTEVWPPVGHITSIIPVPVVIEEDEEDMAPRRKRRLVIDSESDSEEEDLVRAPRKRKVHRSSAARAFLDSEAGVDGDASADEDEEEMTAEDMAFINNESEESDHGDEPDYDSEYESDGDDDNFDLEL
jgi:hypothetical protein